jgi:gliding motility-associated-like protein
MPISLRFIVTFLFASLFLHTAEAQIVINEYSCANKAIIADDFGNYEDWIELHNPTGAAIDISGYFLSDKLSNPTKWQIPAGTVINANGYRLFYASGRDANTGLALHTNFKLTQTQNERILFSDQGGVIIDSLSTRPTRVNHSRGRTPNGSPTWQIFSSPTAGLANGAGFDDYVATPVLSLPAGFYGGAQSISMSCATPGASIRYTTNGAEPNATSTLYSGPVNVATSTAIKARAFPASANLLAGFTETSTYLLNISHDIPVVSLVSNDYASLFSGGGWGEITSNLEYFTSTGVLQFEAYGESDPHGNDSWAYPQKGVDFVVRDQYGYNNEIDYQIFPTTPRTKFQRIMFKAGASDNYPFTNGSGGGCHLRDAYIQSLAERANMHVDLRRNDHCAVYINGEYWGLYEVREKMNDPDYTDYYWNQAEPDIDLLSFWGGLNVRYGSAADWNNLYATIMSTDLSVQANYNTITTRLDIASVIDYIILNSWSVNSDWINWNTMWWRGRANPEVKWKYSLWDMDNTFNLGQNFSGWPTTGFNADPCALDDNFENAGPNEGHLDIFNRLMANEEFKARFVNRYAEMINTYLGCEFALAHFDSVVAHITPEMPQQIARWGGTMAEWQSHLTFMRNQIIGRCEYIEQNGIINCYEVDGPHDLAFNVEPAGAGTIRFNELQIPSYPWSGGYFGGVEAEIEATPSGSSYEFWYWEVFNSDLTNDSTIALNSFMIEAADSIVAHFRIIETHEITFIVEPAGSGNVSINGITPATYPYSAIYNAETPISLSATPNTFFEFVWYEAAQHSFSPDSANANVYFEVDTADVIIVHFRPLVTYELTLIVDPPNAGKIWLDGLWYQDYPSSKSYYPTETPSFNANAEEEYLFSHWTLNEHILLSDSSMQANACIIDTADTLTAHFILREVIPQTMYVPSSFTPNGDDKNDVFKCYHTETVTDGNVVIFNRWGEEVFRAATLDFEWDGTLNKQFLPEGVYYYVLNYYLKADYFETAQGKIVLFR